MNGTALKAIEKPLKVKVTRIEEIFEATNPYKPIINSSENIIKDYVYSQEKRFLI